MYQRTFPYLSWYNFPHAEIPVIYTSEFRELLEVTTRNKGYLTAGTMLRTPIKYSFHLAVCLTTGPKPLPKRALRIVQSRASSFK
jgi:hypothetical protein